MIADDISNLERVLSFIQIHLSQDHLRSPIIQVQKTNSMEGMNPDWNQILRFKIIPKTKGQAFTCQELSASSSHLTISLFDSLSSIKNRRDNPNKFTLTVTKHFLGNIRIPLVYLFHSQKIEAAFKIQRPIILFGYYNAQSDAILNQLNDDVEINITNPAVPTYLHLNLAVDPIVEIPKSKNESDYFPGYEDTQFLIMGSNWIDKVKTNREYGKRSKLLLIFSLFFIKLLLFIFFNIPHPTSTHPTPLHTCSK